MGNLIIQAAKDYDIDIDIVEDIYEQYPDNFYEKLEEYIKERRRP